VESELIQVLGEFRPNALCRSSEDCRIPCVWLIGSMVPESSEVSGEQKPLSRPTATTKHFLMAGSLSGSPRRSRAISALSAPTIAAKYPVSFLSFRH